ncbi:hypothetical protein [Methylobacterium gnaphalii]|uniref:Uncharacterized protein n=1 Tax=Methylobacterium gnaphalii TaxID=1010610 RepID=A0A512JPD9_9HYPH|nr:hypothetical protein [Methylobacterium gnaphalii]GEP11826.1 hypothetical protein MGN01_36710 [Methylobacterium gnaphalii]GJD69410.1 hypothetical protein MMMDOFMJ_2341 [Methylobacterium gnaphalii]GLS49539.1 hypothetical protein GCM10007885_23880 [Methylobacterium gnaphalii]
MRLMNRLVGAFVSAAALIAGSAHAEQAEAKGVYTIEHRNAAGELLYSEEFKNLVVTSGKNLLLDTFLSGSSYTAALYLGLVDGASAPTFAAADTLASHAGWTENQGYSNAGRPAATFNAAVAGAKASVSIVFNINASGTIAGCFLCTSATKGGTTGTLISAGAFAGGNRLLQSGDTLSVTYNLSV